jgi:hypothetical protein
LSEILRDPEIVRRWREMTLRVGALAQRHRVGRHQAAMTLRRSAALECM